MNAIVLAAQIARWSNDTALSDEQANLLKDASTILRRQYDELHQLTACHGCNGSGNKWYACHGIDVCFTCRGTGKKVIAD